MANNILYTGTDLSELKDEIAQEVVKLIKKEELLSGSRSRLMTVTELSKMLHVSEQTIYAWKRDGILPFKRISRKIYFDYEDIMQSLKDIRRKNI